MPETRARWWALMLAVWAASAALILLHTVAVRDYVALLDAQGQRGVGEARTPLQQVIPARYADTQMWTRLALDAADGGELRVRWTQADNAPLGREVHWSSALVWLLRGAAAVHRWLTSESGPQAVEHTLLWFNAPLLFALLVALSAWVGRRAGAVAGMVAACAMIGHKRFYEGFLPAYVDHHGLINAAILGLLLGAAFMGGGWWKSPAPPGRATLLPSSRESARSAAIVSGLCGGLGLWLGAAAVAPVIALVGVAGLGMAWWTGRDAQQRGAQFDPTLWRLWGRVGAVVSFLCYLVEYAPAHFGMRLEVNHPLYALAWWGGAELVATLAEWRLARGGEARPRLLAWRVVGPALAVVAAPLAVLGGGRAVFAIGDPFVGELRHFVAEGMSLPEALRQFGGGRIAYDLTSALLLVPVAAWVWRRAEADRAALGLLVIVAAVLAGMGCGELRWWLDAGTAQVALLVSLTAAVTNRGRRLIAAVALVMLVSAGLRVATEWRENRHRIAAAGDLLQPLYRDLAAALRESQPEGPVVVLASPNASAGIGYFGRFQVLGTLFWENAPGLRAAAEIFSAATDEEALALLRARDVTHVAMVSPANFLGEYYRLLHSGASESEAKRAFGFRLASKLAAPAWLQPIPYRPPPGLKDAAASVLLFRVAPEQTERERLYFTAITRLAEGDTAAAEHVFDQALASSPADSHSAMLTAAGAAFYEYAADAAAVRLFRRVLIRAPDSEVTNTLAWILTTSRDAGLRDGPAALALIEPLRRREPNDPAVLSTFAAACAETGRFAEAVAAAERALAMARTAGDTGSFALLEKRLAKYRANQPWRQ